MSLALVLLACGRPEEPAPVVPAQTFWDTADSGGPAAEPEAPTAWVRVVNESDVAFTELYAHGYEDSFLVILGFTGLPPGQSSRIDITSDGWTFSIRTADDRCEYVGVYIAPGETFTWTVDDADLSGRWKEDLGYCDGE